MASRDESAFEITITNFSICCRLCLSSNDSEHYFDISNTSLASQNDITIIEAIQKVTNSEILLSDKLPTKICKLCSTRLDDAYCFIRDFFRTNEMLQNFLYNEEPDRFADDDQIADSYSVVESDEQGDAVTEMELGDLALREQRIFGEEGDEPHPSEPSSGDCLDGEKRDLTAVEFILQKIGTKRPAKPRIDNRTSVRTARHACTLCEKTFMRRSNLIDHLRLHAKVKMYECDYCDKRFVQSGNLKSHLRTHTAEKPFECGICGKSFTQSSSLKTHMLTHTNVKPYVCDVCDKGFTSSSDLSKHKRTHTGVKPYQCIICPDRQFTQKVHLRNHLARMHPTSNISQAIELGDFNAEKRTIV